MARLQNPVQMAVIGAAHGIRGEVRVKSFTADPLALGDYGSLYDPGGRRFEILELRPQKDMLVVRFKGVADRSAAEALNGTALFVERAALPDDLEAEEFYHADLVGLEAIDEAGSSVGRVKAVFDHGGGDILELALAGGGTALIPFSKAAVPVIDIAAGRIVVDGIAAGLGENEDDPRHHEEGVPPRAGGRDDFDPGDRPRGPKSAGGNR